MMIANGSFRKLGGYNNNSRQQPNTNYIVGPCFRCQGDHWVRDYPIDQEENTQTRGLNPSWPRVTRYCADCGIEHLAKNCPVKMIEKSFNLTSLGIIEVIPSPVTSENESEPITLLAIGNIPHQSVERIIEGLPLKTHKEPLLQELTLHEQQIAKRENKTRHSSETYSDTGSWESIILETPEGVKREYILKHSPPLNKRKQKGKQHRCLYSRELK